MAWVESGRNARAVPAGNARGKRGSDPASGLPTRGKSEAATLASRPESRLKIRALARKNLAWRENAHHPCERTDVDNAPRARRIRPPAARAAAARCRRHADRARRRGRAVGQRRAAAHQALSRIGPDAPGRRARIRRCSATSRWRRCWWRWNANRPRHHAAFYARMRSRAGSAAVLRARGRMGLPGDPRDHRRCRITARWPSGCSAATRHLKRYETRMVFEPVKLGLHLPTRPPVKRKK